MKSSGPVFYSIGIIITAYIPIFTLQRVEGRLFKPMAWTVAFALGRRLDLFHAACARARQLPVSERRQGVAQPADERLFTRVYRTLSIRRSAGATSPSRIGVLCLGGTLWLANNVGSEFLPHLDEGAIWVRGTLAPSTGPTEGNASRQSGRA